MGTHVAVLAFVKGCLKVTGYGGGSIKKVSA